MCHSPIIKISFNCSANFVLFYYSLLLYTLLQFDLTIAPLQNTGLINAKYNNTLSGKYNNTLYGTTNTNKFNIFLLILKVF